MSAHRPAATQIIVESAAVGKRLDRYLAERGGWGSRSQVQRLIQDGRVLVDGATVKASAVLRSRDVIRLEVPEAVAPASVATPEDIALDVLYEDEDLLVINKPAGLVVHPAPGNWSGTLVNALLHRWRGPRPGLDAVRPGIVHRLDKDTSGVLVIAKTPDVLVQLASQFRSRTVHKEYLAVVWRCPAQRSGIIDRPIARHPTQRKRMTTRAGGRPAVTRYEVIEDFGIAAVLRVHPETGRTHQIRVHLAAIGHPVIGDPVYGRSRRQPDPHLGEFERQALHAAALEFDHPRSGKRMRHTAPEAADFGLLRSRLRAARQQRNSA